MPSVCVGVLLLLSTDFKAFESQASGLVDRWQIYFGARCCLRQSIVDVCSGTPTPGRQLTLADVVLGFMGRSALHGLTVHWVMGCAPACYLSHQGHIGVFSACFVRISFACAGLAQPLAALTAAAQVADRFSLVDSFWPHTGRTAHEFTLRGKSMAAPYTAGGHNIVYGCTLSLTALRALTQCKTNTGVCVAGRVFVLALYVRHAW